MLLFDTGKKLEKAFTKEQFDALVDMLEKRDGSLATSQELTDATSALKTDIAAVKGDVAEVKHAIREAEMHFDTKMKELELRLLKWQLSIGFAIILVMAKGFGWLGF